jgi:hypothetical protein
VTDTAPHDLEAGVLEALGMVPLLGWRCRACGGRMTTEPPADPIGRARTAALLVDAAANHATQCRTTTDQVPA